jgi:hypothetical protein
MRWIEVTSLVASLATTLAAVAVVITVAIYYGQLRAMTKSRDLESLILIMSYVNDLEFRRARYLMLEHAHEFQTLFSGPVSWDSRRAADKRIRQISSDEVTLHSVDLAMNALNNVCYLIRYGYAPVEAADALLKHSLLRSWNAFAPYIEHRRSRPDIDGAPSRYAEHFEWVIANKYHHDVVSERPIV